MTVEFYYRTEDIRQADILRYFVETREDRKLLSDLKSKIPILLEGSRGTGKSFLMRVAEAELEQEFHRKRVLPVYVSFLASSLVHTNDPNQFLHWMLARSCAELLRKLRVKGLIALSPKVFTILSGEESGRGAGQQTRIELLAEAYEESWRANNVVPDSSALPTVEALRDAVQDLCEQVNIAGIRLLFDEAAHVFRPDQQRQFFTLFRDLRSPYISCKAAIYPGVTSFGPNFQVAHDATLRKVERDILSADYRQKMKEVVFKQADDELTKKLKERQDNLSLLAYAAHGNPRLLLKSVARAPRLISGEIISVLKGFYRTEIWGEFTAIGDTYESYRPLVDWGRDFIEKQVLPSLKRRNDERREQGGETSAFIWIHRDSPPEVKKAMQLLGYSGIVQKLDENVRGTRSELGTRYAVNFGCLLALEGHPTTQGIEIARRLTVRRFSEYGANHSAFQGLVGAVDLEEAVHTRDVLQRQLERGIEKLDLSEAIKGRLNDAKILTISDILSRTEKELIDSIYYVGPVRAKRISNEARAAVLEFLVG